MDVLVLPGDGIGPEISAATLTVLDRVNERFQLGLAWQHDEMGFVTLKNVRSETLQAELNVGSRKPAHHR